MQQRQLRLGDILDDYCPRERRVTNHAVVAMVGDAVKQTRCTTCDAEHEYKHAKIPRQRRKADTPAALYAQVAANGPKRHAHEGAPEPHATSPHMDEPLHDEGPDSPESAHMISDNGAEAPHHQAAADERDEANAMADEGGAVPGQEEEGPVHRPLIRASLPRPEGQQPPARPIPEFTIRQPGGRPGRFRPRHQRGGGGQQGQQFHGGNRGNGHFAGGPPRGARPGSGRPQGGGMPVGRRNGPGRKRSK
jgi:hypothetical protein